jgi:biotin synthase
MQRYDWTREEIAHIYQRPLLDLVFEAQKIHRRHFKTGQVQKSTLLSIKTGKCPEDCSYCPQSSRYKTETEDHQLLPLSEVIDKARAAKEAGSTRFCMGAAWRDVPKGHEFEDVLKMVREVKALGMETCSTLGMLNKEQASELKKAGLDYYNHNLDTSPEYYGEIITTRTYQERRDTLKAVRESGMKVCCGGIIGMGESREDRIGLLHELAMQDPHPESVPINRLVPVAGTPLADQDQIDPIEFVRCIATARILMPQSFVRLSAGRTTLSDAEQALCFMAGANSIFAGEKLLTTPNPEINQDASLFSKLGLRAMS